MHRKLWVFGLMTCLAVMAGCGGGIDGPPRFPTNGTVKVDGKPVEHGQISFLPVDGGGMTSIAIVNGEFTSSSKGVVGGPQKVTVTLLSGPQAGDGDDDGEVETIGVASTTATVSDSGEAINIDLQGSQVAQDNGDPGREDDGEDDEDEDDDE